MVGDPGPDLVAPPLPPVDPIDAVPAQPVALGPAGGAVLAEELGHVRCAVAALCSGDVRDGEQLVLEFALLPAGEADSLGKETGVPSVGDDDLDLPRRVLSQPG